jgi:hypothetical protein
LRLKAAKSSDSNLCYTSFIWRSSYSLAQAQAQAQKAGLPTLNFSKLKPTGYDFETTLSARGSITARARGAYAAAQQVGSHLSDIADEYMQ